MTADLLTAYYWLSVIAATTGTVLLIIAAQRAPFPLRPWYAAAVPAAVGFVAVNIGRLVVEDDTTLGAVARGLTLYTLIVLYNAMPYAAIRNARQLTPPAVLDNLVGEVARQLEADTA